MEEKYYLALLHSLGITQKKLHIIFGENLLGEEGSYKKFYEKLNYKTLASFGVRKNEIESILKRRETVKLESIQKKLEDREVKIITVEDKEYPEELKNVPNSPYLFYLRGRLPNGPKIAVVGARKISSYGKKVIENIVPEVSRYFPIVSGGAFGCDTYAHNSCLDAGNKTISVVGTSICEDYPTGNKKMYDSIVENGGGVLSIFPVGVPGNAYNFPIRNEIVAGLSVGVLVVEAQYRSGSLITAKLTLDLGKDLFAIPGEIFKSNSAGCNNLIRNGEAKPVSEALHILEEYNFCTTKGVSSQEKTELSFDNDIEEKIYNALLLDGLSADELAKKLEINISTLSFSLSMLEIKGIIRKTMGGVFEVK
ncbi:DNA-processing protein DprA [Candidatus Gracilibacteria bacterium]|nr:DNA-processing protein DprA [Candidatus Gracilibacteria bacterium]